MNQIYSQCDIPDHSGEYIIGLCFDKSCLQKPEYCYICKTEGQHYKHQNSCKSYSQMKNKLTATLNVLKLQRESLLKQFQNISLCMSDVLYQSYQKKLDECQLLIEISKDENVEQSKNKIDLYQYYLEFILEQLRQFIQRAEEICQQFNNQMNEAINAFELPIRNDSVIESLNSNQQSEVRQILDSNNQEKQNLNPIQIHQDNDEPQVYQVLQANEINDEDDDIFKLQIQMIQEEEQYQNISKSIQLTTQANQNSNPQIAMQLLDQAIELFQNNEEALLQKGIILFNQRKYDQSMQTLEKLIQQNSQSSQVYSLYADCLLKKDRFQEADQFYQKAIQISPNDSKLYQSRGHILCSLGKFQEAIDCSDKELALNNQSATAYNTKAHALSCLDRIQESLDNYDLAHHLKPREIIYLTNKGILLLNQNKLDEASVCLNKIEQLADRSELYFKFKSGLLMKQGKQAEALETCIQGLQLYPDNENLQQKKQQLWVNEYINTS